MRLSTISALCLAAGALEAQYSVWTPGPGQAVVTPVFVTQSFRDIWMGSHPMRLDDSVGQRTVLASFEVGMTNRIALDFTSGYSRVNSAAFGGPMADSGLTDTLLGVRWRLHRDLAIRVGGVVRGTYTPNYPFSAGDGGSGAEFSVLGGHTFGESGFSMFGDAGYRVRTRGVPPDVFGSAGVAKWLGAFALSGTYRQARGLTGQDIGDPGFTFPQLREVHHTVEGGLTLHRGGSRSYQLFAARTFQGRNTGRKTVVGMAVSFGFKMPWRR
ncbi:MAG: hypothetical protein U0Q16_35230 [Bryobacteraceae bacterium]